MDRSILAAPRRPMTAVAREHGFRVELGGNFPLVPIPQPQRPPSSAVAIHEDQGLRLMESGGLIDLILF